MVSMNENLREKDGLVTKKCLNLAIEFDEIDKPHMNKEQEEILIKVLKATISLWTDVGDTMATAFVTGGIMGGLAAY